MIGLGLEHDLVKGTNQILCSALQPAGCPANYFIEQIQNHSQSVRFIEFLHISCLIIEMGAGFYIQDFTVYKNGTFYFRWWLE